MHNVLLQADTARSHHTKCTTITSFQPAEEDCTTHLKYTDQNTKFSERDIC